MAAAYGTNAVYQGYVSKFYQQRGARGNALTWLLVSFPLMSALAQPVCGLLADRVGKRRVLRALILLSMPILPLMARQRGFPGILLCACAFACFYPAVQPLSDSLILGRLTADGLPYGPVRLAGCLAYAVCSLAAGFLLREDYAAVPAAVSLGLGAVFTASLLLPESETGRRRRVPLRALLRVPALLPLLALFMALQTTLGCFYSYFAIFFTALPGAGGGRLGLSLFLATLSEAPFLLAGDRLFRRFGAGRLLLLAALSLGVRFLMLGFARSAALATASQLLHGLGFVVMTFSMAEYVSRSVPPDLRASGQTLAAAVSGLARVTGSLLGGLIGEKLGLRAAFLCAAAIALLSFTVFLPRFSRIPPLNGQKKSRP